MKTLINSYVFDPVAKTITTADVPVLLLENLLLITNVTTNTIIYNFADPTFVGTTISGDSVILAPSVNTTGMNATDRLQIFMDLDYSAQIPNSVIVDTSSVPLVTSGVDATGITRPVKVGVDGGLQLSDTVGPFYLTVPLAVNSISDLTINATGYTSLTLEITGTTGTGGVNMQQSMDGKTWYSVSGWPASTSSTMSSGIYGVGLYYYPVVGKYIRLVNNGTATTTNIIGAVYLKANTLPNMWSGQVRGANNQGQSTNLTPAVDVAGWDGAAIRRLITDANGYLLIKGGTGVGITAGSQPIQIGGVDSNGKIRNALTDVYGDISTIPSTSSNAVGAVDELLGQILLELKTLNIYLKELPLYLNNGINNNDSSEDLLRDVSFTDKMRS